jgi:hypothetical protein
MISAIKEHDRWFTTDNRAGSTTEVLLLALFVVRCFQSAPWIPGFLDEWARAVITDSPDFEDGAPWKQPERGRTDVHRRVRVYQRRRTSAGGLGQLVPLVMMTILGDFIVRWCSP